MKRKKSVYFICPAGADKWIRTLASEVRVLKKAGYTLDLQRMPGTVTDCVFITVKQP